MDINVICITLEPKLLCIFSKEIILIGKLARFFFRIVKITMGPKTRENWIPISYAHYVRATVHIF